MPVNIYDLTSDRKTMSIPVGKSGDKLTLTYRPNSLTPAREMAIMRRADTEISEDEDYDSMQVERNIRRQIETFMDLVESWDFEGPLARDAEGNHLEIPQHAFDDREALDRWLSEHGGTLLVPPGQVIPLTFDNLVVLPSNFHMKLVEAINADMRPNPKRGRR